MLAMLLPFYHRSFSLILFCFNLTLVCSHSVSRGATTDFNPLRSISPNIFLELVSGFYKSTNIRGGNSQFKYIPPKNYREIYVYELSQFEGNKKIKDYVDAALSKKVEKRNPILEALAGIGIKESEQVALKKGIFTVCKWAIPVPSFPLSKLDQCTDAELKAVLTASFI